MSSPLSLYRRTCARATRLIPQDLLLLIARGGGDWSLDRQFGLED